VEKRTLDLSAVRRSPSLFEVVSEQLLEAIREANLTPGTRIPSERELAEQFGVSRTVVRESIRHLSAKGVLEVVSGAGVQVADMNHEGVSESLELYLRQRGVLTPQAMYEVRQTLECKAAELAAERADDEQVQVLIEICDEMHRSVNDADAASKADVAFHRAVAQATGNALFVVLIDSIGDVMFHMRRMTLNDPARGKFANEAHRAIAQAIAEHDSVAARRAMEEHLDDSIAAYQRSASTV